MLINVLPYVYWMKLTFIWLINVNKTHFNASVTMTGHLLSPDHASGTACQLAFVIRHCLREHSQHYCKLTCLFNGRGAGVFELVPQKFILWYDMIWGWLEQHFATHCCTDGCYYLLLHEMLLSAYRVTQKSLVTLRGGVCNVCFGILTSVIT